MDPATLGGVVLALMGLGCLVGLAIMAFVCWVLQGCLARIPGAHRKQSPGMVWLLMIPLFNFIWNFMVFPKVSESFDSYFKAKGETADTAGGLANTFCILFACQLIVFVPFLGLLVYPLCLVNLVLLIILLVKFTGLKNRIPAA